MPKLTKTAIRYSRMDRQTLIIEKLRLKITLLRGFLTVGIGRLLKTRYKPYRELLQTLV